jgi:uncharacterized protein YyaL (SSP411 family)
LSETETLRHLARARDVLLEVRNARTWPGRDEKVLTSWNGLTIAAMAVASRALQRPDLADVAIRAVDFIRQHQWSGNRLLAVHAQGQSGFPAYLDDYAFLLDALLEVLQTRWRSEDLELATHLADALLAHFADPVGGGFFFTADDHEALIHRSKTFADEALPAGNAIAARALLRLGLLLGDNRYLDAASRTFRAAWPALARMPHAHTTMLTALDEQLEWPTLVIIRGEATEVEQWREELTKFYAPKRLVFAIPASEHALPDAIAAKAAMMETVAYACQGMTCSEPLRSISALIALTQR